MKAGARGVNRASSAPTVAEVAIVRTKAKLQKSHRIGVIVVCGADADSGFARVRGMPEVGCEAILATALLELAGEFGRCDFEFRFSLATLSSTFNSKELQSLQAQLRLCSGSRRL